MTGTCGDLFSSTVRWKKRQGERFVWRTPSKQDVIPLNYGDPFPGSLPNEELVRSLEEGLRQDPHYSLQYGVSRAEAKLRDVIDQWLRRKGMGAPGDEVVLTSGSTQALDLACRLFLDEGDLIILEAPTYMGALRVFGNFGIECLAIRTDGNGMVTGELAKALETRSRSGSNMPKLAYVIPTFQNPKGVTLSLPRRKHLLELAEQYNFVIVEDDPYSELRFEGDPLPAVKQLDEGSRVLYVGTLSKIVAPGVRVGWVFTGPEIAREVSRIKPGYDNSLALVAVSRYFDAVDIEQRLSWLRESYRSRRDAMLNALAETMPPGVSWTRPQGGLFVWVELPRVIDASVLLERAIARGVAFLRGSLFFFDQGPSNALRLSYSYVSPQQIEEGVDILADVVLTALKEKEATAPRA